MINSLQIKSCGLRFSSTRTRRICNRRAKSTAIIGRLVCSRELPSLLRRLCERVAPTTSVAVGKRRLVARRRLATAPRARRCLASCLKRCKSTNRDPRRRARHQPRRRMASLDHSRYSARCLPPPRGRALQKFWNREPRSKAASSSDRLGARRRRADDNRAHRCRSSAHWPSRTAPILIVTTRRRRIIIITNRVIRRL